MNADDPPIAADENMIGGNGEKSSGTANFHDAIHQAFIGSAANCHSAAHQAFIGGNRRVIGVHRREPPYPRASVKRKA